jgi:hypothetical protein
MGPPSLMHDCAAAVGTAQAVFLLRSKLAKPHRFPESLARVAVTQRSVKSLTVVQANAAPIAREKMLDGMQDRLA